MQRREFKPLHSTVSSGGSMMITPIRTGEQLAQMPGDENRYELVAGVLGKMSPAGGRCGRVAGRIFRSLANHVRQHGLGETFAAETGFVLARNPDTVRAPDAAFVNQGKMDLLQDESGLLPFAPDLAVEVVSPITTNTRVKDWPGIFAGDSTMTAAILDRLLHKSEALNFCGRSCRRQGLPRLFRSAIFAASPVD